MQGYILCDSNYMTFWKRRNGRDGKKIVVARGLGGGKRSEQVPHMDFYKTVLHDTIMVGR